MNEMKCWIVPSLKRDSQKKKPKKKQRSCVAGGYWLNVIGYSVVTLAAIAFPHTIFAKDPQSADSAINQKIDVGILATRGNLDALNRWLPTMDWLERKIPHTEFVLHPYTLEQMTDAVKTQTVDFVITNPGQSVLLGRQYPLSWLATLRSQQQGGTTLAIGSALVVRNDSPYFTLTDLDNQPVAAVSDSAFGGYLTLRRNMQQLSLDPNRFFSTVDFFGFPLDAILYKLRDKHVEAAVLPVCQLETMGKEGLIDFSQYRVLDNQAPVGFGCQVSTALYPNWSFAKTGKASETLAKQIARALLDLPERDPAATAAHSLGWSAPISQLKIDKLYQDLDLHPLQKPWWQEALTWLKSNQQWGWTFLLFVVVLNLYHFLLEYRFSRSQRLLIATQNRLKEKNAMLEHAQRVAIVGELGGSIAHEINQPLSAIRNYSQGGLVRINKGSSADDLKVVLEKIQQQVIRADDIVQRLRSLIKKRPINKQYSNVQALITDAVMLLDHDLIKHQITLSVTESGQAVPVYLDPIGFQQLLLNLVKNAMDACVLNDQKESLQKLHTQEKYQIVIDTEYLPVEKQMKLVVTDNGIGLEADAALLQSAFFTTKEEGLGLGLAICRDVVEDHHGTLAMTANNPHGCRIEVRLPYIANTEN